MGRWLLPVQTYEKNGALGKDFLRDLRCQDRRGDAACYFSIVCGRRLGDVRPVFPVSIMDCPHTHEGEKLTKRIFCFSLIQVGEFPCFSYNQRFIQGEGRSPGVRSWDIIFSGPDCATLMTLLTKGSRSTNLLVGNQNP